MGTTYNISLVEPSELSKSELHNIHEVVKLELAMLDRAMSTYKPQSEISRFNNAPVGQFVELSDATMTVLRKALSLNKLTGGAFDSTVGPLVDAWGFGAGSEAVARVADQGRIELGLSMIGMERFELSGNTLRKLKDVELDLSAIAKGFAVDRVADVLKVHGRNDFLVEIGGEVVTRGKSIRNSLWVLGIESPDKSGRNVYTRVDLGDSALATSGDYRNYFEKQGKRFSHTINPQSGKPVEHKLASVSVVAENCMLADGMATALMVMGEESGFVFAEKHNISAFFIYRDGESLITKHTEAFVQYLK